MNINVTHTDTDRQTSNSNEVDRLKIKERETEIENAHISEARRHLNFHANKRKYYVRTLQSEETVKKKMHMRKAERHTLSLSRSLKYTNNLSEESVKNALDGSVVSWFS